MTDGLVCLQGGGEFRPDCRDLDLEVLRRTPPGPIVVVASAAWEDGAYAKAGRNARRWFQRLGADAVAVAPDPLDDAPGAVEVLAQAAMIALPGGSPSRLLDALSVDGVTEVLRERHAAGATLWGASAGAMVLCRHTLLPDRDRAVVDGLGFVPGLALPHWSGSPRFEVGLPADVPRWGLPEAGSVLATGEGVVAAGRGTPVVLVGNDTVELPRDEAYRPPAH